MVPYSGFYLNADNGYISAVYVDPILSDDIQVGDQVLQIGAVSWEEFRINLRQAFFHDTESGQIVPIVVNRGEQEIQVDWMMPGENSAEKWGRLVDIWWLAYVFWIAGLVTALIIRPKDHRWRLLLGFNLLTAVWLMAGTISGYHLWQSAIVLRSALWLCVPVYIQLHWEFPKPLGNLSRFLWGFLYLAGIGLAVIEWFQLLPSDAYFLAALIAVLGSLLLIIIHFKVQPDQRRDIKVLFFVALISLLPLLGVVSFGLAVTQPSSGALALLALPGLPGAYLYSAYRRQSGWLELRANRAVVLYLYFVLLITLAILLGSLNLATVFPGSSVLLNVIMVVAVGLITIFGFPKFERFIERRLLGIRLPPEQLLSAYISQITTGLDRNHLVRLLKDDILPSLLVRQSALLRIVDEDHFQVVYVDGLDETQLPTDSDIQRSLINTDYYDNPHEPASWLRLVLPLHLEGELIGLWLLGERDPDDKYNQVEIKTLKLLANQTAIALSNIVQAEQLHTLYQANIDRHEEERSRLARILHDEVLNELAVLPVFIEGSERTVRFKKAHQLLISRIRQTISGLRPTALDYGLWTAIDELVDDLTERVGDQVLIDFQLSPTDIRYSHDIEQHLFRAVQEGLENAIKHSQAQLIGIHGELAPDMIRLTIQDDGAGFLIEEPINLTALLAQKHFGLVGIHERCLLIGASLELQSEPGEGVQMTITWEAGT